MELNKEKIDSLSIADAFALYQALDKEDFKNDKPIQCILFELRGKASKLIVELTTPTEPFDFEAWLLRNGWSRFNKTTTTVYFDKQYNEGGIETAKLGLNNCNIVTCSRRDVYLFGKCKKPSSIQEAETLFKLFNL